LVDIENLMRVLLIDDDNALATLLSHHLTAHNYIVDRVTDGEEGWVYGSTFEYDLIILDWMLPKLDGIHLCQRFRNEGYGVPILLLTAKDEQTDKIRGLEAGADDYVVKPFDTAELLARIRTLLRRRFTEPEPLLGWGKLCLDPISCEVTYEGQRISLTAKEYSLLELLLRHSQQVFSANDLLDRIWSSEEFPSEATVRSHIRGLRRKLKAVGKGIDLIETVRGLGYRLKSQAIQSIHQSNPANLSLKDKHAIYLDGLTRAWNTHKSESIERCNYLITIAQLSKDQDISEQQRIQSRQTAHSLAGTLGTFGLMEGYHIAIQIEHLLQAEENFSLTQKSQLQALATTLRHAIDEPPQLISSEDPYDDKPRVLTIDICDVPYVQQLIALFVAQKFQVNVAASLESAEQILSMTSSSSLTSLQQPENLPDVVLINLVSNETDLLLDESTLKMMMEFIETLAKRWPQLPIVTITPQADFGNRLDLIRRGSTIVMEYPLVPSDILAVVTREIHHNLRFSKIMIVDDDSHHLKQITHFLQPWGFQITPLENSSRFWTLFTQVKPDAVVLDIEMPHVNGFELCQTLRSHPEWQHLPIMFLSIHSETLKQHQAFACGADDYITKPVQGKDLAVRLLNRLKRHHALLQWQQTMASVS